MTPLSLFIVLAGAVFAALGWATRVGTLRQVRVLQKTPDSSAAAEPPSPPSVLRLVMGLVLISITVVFWLRPSLSFVSTLCICLTPWGTRRRNRDYYNKPLTKRDGFWIAIGLLVIGLLIFGISKIPFPNFEPYLEHPAFTSTLWAFLTGLFVWQWCVLRQVKPEAAPAQPATA